MNIHIDPNAEDYRRAQVLYMILKDRYSSETNNSVRTIISILEQQLKTYLDNPVYRQFAESTQKTMEAESMTTFTIKDILSSLSDFFTGPGRRELELGRQRKEQLERAEHAETTAFEALAESADLKKALDEAQRKIHVLEAQLGTGRHST